MFSRLGLAAARFLLLAVLAGCATTGSVPEIPSSLGDNQGLLVARLYVPGTLAWENAQIKIDGRMYGSNVRDGYIGVALDSGEHHLIELRVQGWQQSAYQPEEEAALRKVRGGGTYRAPIIIPGRTYTTYYTTLSVDRKFTIEAGKVTNLGLIVYLEAPADPKKPPVAGQRKSFVTVALDNSAEMNTYLETNYPALVASLKTKSVQLSPAKYLEAKRLPELRRFIAAAELKSHKAIAGSDFTAVYGDAGTLVTVKPGANGQKAGIEILETGTLADIVDARRDGDRLLFLTSEGKVLSLERGKLAASAVTRRVHAVRLGVFGDGRLAVADNHMRILTSADRGATWTSYDAAAIEIPSNDIGLSANGKDLYFYLGRRGTPTRIVGVAAQDTSPRVIAPPTSSAIPSSTGNSLVAREAGLFIVGGDGRSYFLPRDGREWKFHSPPAEKCKPISFDDAGRRLDTECEGVKYQSADSGATWSKVGL